MKTTIAPFFLFILLAIAILSCKKPDALDKATSKNLLITNTTTLVRYRDSVFAKVDSFPNIFYRTVQNYDRVENLKLDVYMPAGDTATTRACVIYIHGGGWSRLPENGPGTRKGERRICLAYAKRGYVVISPSYRLGIAYNPSLSRPDSIRKLQESVYRSTQDIRALLRFVKKNGTSGGRIDVNKIFIGGGSAGAGAAIHAIYLTEDEILGVFPNLGPLDGNGIYDYPGFDLKVKGVINMAGVIQNKNFIDAGDPTMISSYGSLDPFYKDTVLNSSPHYTFHNGQMINQRLTQLGIATSPIILFQGQGHGNNDPTAFTTNLNTTSAWMYNLLK